MLFIVLFKMVLNLILESVHEILIRTLGDSPQLIFVVVASRVHGTLNARIILTRIDS